MIHIKENDLVIDFIKNDRLDLPCIIGVNKEKTATFMHEDVKNAIDFNLKSTLVNNRLVICTSFDKESQEDLGAKLYLEARNVCEHAVVIIDKNPIHTAALASGAMLRSWDFDVYKTQNQDQKKLKKLTFVTDDTEKAKALFEEYKAVNLGNMLTRHVVSEPPNVLFPESFAAISKELESLGLVIEVLGEAEMRELGFGALLGVGQGSAMQSQLVIMTWKGSDTQPVAIIGKGVTFDSGGISIKPSNNMEDMKYDMAGAGVVLGLMKTLALRKSQSHVIGVMGLAENMPSGTAQRPADVVKSLSGQTIEVVNTDAEGRLVLADALWYTQNRFKPKAMIDLATLTGAVVVALGEDNAGIMSNNDEICSQIEKAGKEVNECVWRLPLSKRKEGYDKDIDSDIADMKNVGSGRGAGTVTAAQFLQRFVNDVPWAHLDIAGVAWAKKGTALTVKGATGFGVRLLNQWIKSLEK